MSLLGLIFIFVLQFEAGVSGEEIHLYSRAGHDAILSCDTASSSDPTCSSVSWFYNRDQSQTFTEVSEGKVQMSSVRAVRLSLDTSCSLIIKNITAEDAGRYICRQEDSFHYIDIVTFLSVLTISPSPPDADPKRDGEVTLECSLFRHTDHQCPQISICWMDETRTVLLGEGEGYKFLGQKNCVSSLTVKRQSGHNRRYTCQLVDEKNNVKIEADYTPVFTGDDQSDESASDSTNVPLSSIMLTLRVAGLILMIVITVLVIRDTRNRKPPDNDNVHTDGDEVTYENDEAHPAATRLD
ncbi:uncharacterized protein [Pagrus major]|uniref:uncharacterized protein n=1 Tax=Pagrus major TaxID=143350 RepID=UPI003CC8D607